jgi:chromosome segregation ATPase
LGEDQFGGATRDPVLLLEQLLGHVAGLRRDFSVMQQDVGQLKQDVGQLKQDVGQLKQDVGQLKQDVGQLKQDMSVLQTGFRQLNEKVDSVRQELKEEIAVVRTEVKGLRTDFLRVAAGLDREQAAFRTEIEQIIDRKSMVSEYRYREDMERLERRIADLEEAERRRKAGESA